MLMAFSAKYKSTKKNFENGELFLQIFFAES